MGGCRCTFRDCNNNTVNSQGKHFFHFPYKDNERCKKWALNSEKISFLRLPWTQLRNKTVCEDHFIDSCFMNVKKERLVKTAVPTMYRTRDGELQEIELDATRLDALVYNFNNKGAEQKTIDLPDSQPQKRIIHLNLAVSETEQADDEYNTIILSDSETMEQPTISANILNDTKPVVLNRIIPKGNIKRFSMRNVAEKGSVKQELVSVVSEPNEASYVTSNPNKRSKVEIGDTGSIVISRTYGKSSANNSIYLQDTLDSDSTSPSNDNGISDPLTVNILEKINDIEERDANKVDKSLYMQMMAENAKQIEDLKKLITDKLTDKKDTSHLAFTSASSASSSTDVRHIRVEKGPAMTKVQLFNGIRKYLNPTMIALLRMEMFGSSEREYRPDEKQLSKELLNLNQNVYDYMRDEWRFRLPPKTDVEEWLKNPDDEETWELC